MIIFYHEWLFNNNYLKEDKAKETQRLPGIFI